MSFPTVDNEKYKVVALQAQELHLTRSEREIRQFKTTRVIITPSRVTKEYGCLRFSRLINVSISDVIEVLSESLFEDCKNLKSVEIGKGVKKVERSCFKGCESLESVTFSGTKLEKLGDESFASCDSLSLLHVPSSLKFLGMYVFLNCSNLVPSNIDSSETNKVSENEERTKTESKRREFYTK